MVVEAEVESRDCLPPNRHRAIALTLDVAATVFQKSKLARPVTMERLDGDDEGYNNVTYKVVTTDGRYAVRLTSSTSWPRAKVEREARAIQFARDKGIQVPELIAVSFANNEVHPDYSLMISEWVDGERLSGAQWPQFKDKVRDVLFQLQSNNFQKIGHGVRSDPFFDLAQDPRPHGPFSTTAEYFLAFLAVRKNQVSKDSIMAALDALIDVVHKHHPELNSVPVVATHGDFCGRNILVNPATQDLWVLDWEWFAAMPAPYEWVLGFDDLPPECKADLLHQANGINDAWSLTYDLLVVLDDFIPWYLALHYSDPIANPLSPDKVTALEIKSLNVFNDFARKYGLPLASSQQQ